MYKVFTVSFFESVADVPAITSTRPDIMYTDDVRSHDSAQTYKSDSHEHTGVPIKLNDIEFSEDFRIIKNKTRRNSFLGSDSLTMTPEIFYLEVREDENRINMKKFVERI